MLNDGDTLVGQVRGGREESGREGEGSRVLVKSHYCKRVL